VYQKLPIKKQNAKDVLIFFVYFILNEYFEKNISKVAKRVGGKVMKLMKYDLTLLPFGLFECGNK
jgi:hypothetical protein